MLSKEEILEIREKLENARHPVFLYDNDADGLCSFLILRRWLGRGEGIAVRSYPELGENYIIQAGKLNADLIVVLDKPVIASAFVEKAKEANLEILIIDHHITEYNFSGVSIYNPALYGRGSEPVSFLAYQIAGRKEDSWLAVIGCIADRYLPGFADDFAKEHGELWKKGVKEAFEAYFTTEIGKIAQAFNFGLKDSIGNVKTLQNFLINCRGPGDVLLECTGNEVFRNHYYALKKQYDEILKEALANAEGKLIFFQYGGKTSMSAELANEISYKFPGKYIVVAYVKQGVINISMRGIGVKRILEKVLPLFPGATGGGHENAVGARLTAGEAEKFSEKVKEIIA